MPLKNPNLFIVGAARSGTTSLWQRLKSHPAVFMPADLSEKEPAFFSDLKRSRFKKVEQYMEIFSKANENHRWIGEASTAYLTDPGSARRIYDFNPRTKIMIILRNPVLRAYSLYNWMVQEGYEYAETFEEALRLEKIRINKKIPNYFEPEYYYNYLYFNSGLYYEQVKRYIDLFKGNVLIIKFEDYINNFSQEWGKICGFLDIEPTSINSHGNINYVNESKQVYSAVLQFVLRKITGFYLVNKESIENNSNNRKSILKEIIFKQVREELETLSKEKKIGLSNRFKVYYLFNKIVDKLYSKILVPDRNTKHERDSLIRLGQRHKKSVKMKTSTFKYLLDQYRHDVAKLSAFIDPTAWRI